MTQKISCGMLIKTTDGYLIGHATNTKHWDILKGGRDPGETSLDAAYRECHEESGIDLHKLTHTLTDLGQHAYKKGKDLHVFLIELDHTIDIQKLKCVSTVQHDKNKPAFPEIDAFKIVSKEEIINYVSPNLWLWLHNHAFNDINTNLEM